MSAEQDALESRLAPGRMRTYRGEDRARLTCPAPPLDGTPEAAQAYVDRITRSAWWRGHCPPSILGDDTGAGRFSGTAQVPRRIIVVQGRGGRGWASYSRHQYRGKWLPRISLGVKHADDLLLPTTKYVDGWTSAITDPYVVLHEVAHIMAACNGAENGHGRVFRYYLVSLVRRWLGPEHAKALQQGYEAEGLKWRRPKEVR